MNRKIILLSIFACFLILLFPIIPAVQYNTTLNEYESLFLEKIKNNDIESINLLLQKFFNKIDQNELFQENPDNQTTDKTNSLLKLLIILYMPNLACFLPNPKRLVRTMSLFNHDGE